MKKEIKRKSSELHRTKEHHNSQTNVKDKKNYIPHYSLPHR